MWSEHAHKTTNFTEYLWIEQNWKIMFHARVLECYLLSIFLALHVKLICSDFTEK